VFGEAGKLQSAEEVLGRWQELKRDERLAGGAAPKSVLHGVPRTLPALLRAYEYGSRAATAGFDWERATDVVAKIREEVDEIAEALGQPSGDGRIEEEVGDLLFAIANLSRKLGVEPESALRRANDKFASRFTELERRLAERGVEMTKAGLAALEAEWQAIKTEDSRARQDRDDDSRVTGEPDGDGSAGLPRHRG
jgi:MazG family protein